MANNPLYDNSLRHWLNFKSPNYGRVEITEPINFDSFSFKIKQRTNGYGRDKEIGAEEIDLEFGNVYGQKTDFPQTLIDGNVIYELSHRLDLIFEALREKGSESEIEYILSRDGVDFVTGLLDIPESTTDGYANFKCSVVQNTNKALIERKKDIKADVFSATDTFGNPQIPLEKTKVLLKAKPVRQISEWTNNTSQTFVDSSDPLKQVLGFNFASFITKSQIEDSYTVFQPTEVGFNFNDTVFDSNFKVLTAKNQLDAITVEITQKMIYEVTQGAIEGGGVVFLYLIYGENYDADVSNPKRITLYNDGWSAGVEKTVNLDETFTYTLPQLVAGESIWIYWGVLGLADCAVNGTVTESNININVTSTAVSSVIDAIPYYDFLKQGVKSVSGLYFEANDIESGEFKDQFILNGNLIRQKDNVPLNFVFKDEMNDLQEVNMDYQIFEDKVSLFQYPDFYRFQDMGAFLQIPDLKFERKFNDRFKKISLNYAYKTYEQDRNEQNTVDAFHTEAQFLFPTTKVGDELKVDINHIRDPFTIETARREALSSTTALTTDEKIFIIDCVAIPEGSTGSITRQLQMQIEATSNLLLIRANGFKWTLLGFKNGDEVSITFGENQGNYVVLQHSDDILELVETDTPAPTFTGLSIITLVYPLTNVFWENRTDEGFDLIENIESPTEVSNLKYTIKRNLMRNAWSSYLATICKDNQNEIIKCTDFKVNGNLTTQFNEGEVLTEKSDIAIADLAEKILDKYEYKTQVAIGFEEAKKLIEDCVNIRGFIRIYDTENRVIKAHPKLLDMSWSEGIMEIVCESRNESEFVTITSNTEGINIFNVGYDSIINRELDWFKINGDYVQIFDNNQKPLINATNFRNISVNGVFFTDKILFYQTLDNL